MKYGVNETFLSFQGEGAHMGRAAYFVRLQGCDQKCGFCDSAGTWHPDWKPEGVPLLNRDDLVLLIHQGLKDAPRGTFVVFTGGEPTLYDLAPVITDLHRCDVKVHIETAGHRELPTSIDWVTMSPKLFSKPPVESSWHRADEIKLVCETPDQMKRDLDTVLEQTSEFNKRCDIWLHPEWSKTGDVQLLRAIVELVKTVPRTRAGFQLHKLYTADFLDENARKEFVPLGGISMNRRTV